MHTIPGATLHMGDCLDVLRTLESESVDAVVTDPPAGIGFMGAEWDSFPVRMRENEKSRSGRKTGSGNETDGVGFARGFPGVKADRKHRAAFLDFLTPRLAGCLRVCKPGAVALVWALPRTSHWTALAIEEAGWIIEDRIAHLFGTGFPKAKHRLKPACEDWWLCRKPGPLWLGVEECKVGSGERRNIEPDRGRMTGNSLKGGLDGSLCGSKANGTTTAGRWPANLALDEEAARLLDQQAGERAGDRPGRKPRVAQTALGRMNDDGWEPRPTRTEGFTDTGGPSRYFYCAKASRRDRGAGNKHPTVKSTALMSWLVKLACPEGGTALDPFMGSGSTGLACLQTGRRFIGIERDPDYFAVARRRVEGAVRQVEVAA